jgi:hypothetical protein
MGKFHEQLLEQHIAFIKKQHMFFVATSPLNEEGHINLSPKGGDTFRVWSPTSVGYMDFTGSGNETSAHLVENGRITFMFCAYEGPPNILRLYGAGRCILPSDDAWAQYAAHFTMHPAVRQIIVADIHKVQTSCGYSVPLYSYTGERDQLDQWAAHKGEAGLEAYRQEKNRLSIDGLPTAIY